MSVAVEELKRCPFCGSRDVCGDACLGSLLICCKNCHAKVTFNTPELDTYEQLKLWNTRK